MINVLMLIMQLEVILLTVFAVAGLYYGYKALGVWCDNRKYHKQARHIEQSAQQIMQQAARRRP